MAYAMSVLLFAVIYISSTTTGETAQCSFKGRGESDEEIKIILDAHNSVREQIAQGKFPGLPKATNMKMLKYDKKLAARAQEVADTCIFHHLAKYDSRWPVKLGQNLETSTGQKDWKLSIENWIGESKNYSYTSEYQTKFGHFTQVIWANTEYVGCGYSEYPKNDSTQRYYVCQYGPIGNIRGQYPYAAA